MSVRPSIDRQTFLSHVLDSGLITDSELADLAERLPDSARGRVVARYLVEQGILTKYQAERLLAGRSGGFVMAQYRILDQLGKGGMGRVYKAVHVTMRRVVALKVLAPQLVKTREAQLLFLREMRAVAQLTHPNIVTAFDANLIGDRYYLVMEFVDGPNLDALVREQGPLPIGMACELIRQTSEGLQYASELGMVHRDIKPLNLLVLLPGKDARRQRSVVKILDFGLARLQGREADDSTPAGTILTRPNMIMGTPDFVSPEQATDVHAVDIRSDLYSLGCTFYYLLTGRVPFPGGSTLEKLVRHGTQEPAAVESLRPEVPPAVAAIVRRLMAKEPGERFQTPAELASALAPLATEDLFAIHSSSPAEIPEAEDVAGVPVPEEAFTTPVPAPDSGFDFQSQLPTNDGLAAMHSTLPFDLLSNAPVSPAVGARRAPLAERRRLQLAVVISIAVVGILVGVLALLISLTS